MPAPLSLVQAALNRLAVRLASGLADAAAELSLLAQDTPGRLSREWQLFVEEVELEADRLDHGEAAAQTSGPPTWSADGQADTWAPSPRASQPLADPQDQIDQLRAQVAALARQLEDRS